MAIQRVIIRADTQKQRELAQRLHAVADDCGVRVQQLHVTAIAAEFLCQGAMSDLGTLQSTVERLPLGASVLAGSAPVPRYPLTGGESPPSGAPSVVFTSTLEPLGWELSQLQEGARGRARRTEGSETALSVRQVETRLVATPQEPLAPERDRPSGPGPAPGDDEDFASPHFDDDPLTL